MRYPARHLTPQYVQLTAERCVLCFKPTLRLEWHGQDAKNEIQQRDHHGSLSDSGTPSTRIGFSVYTTGRRDIIISLAARYRLPAVYPFRFFVDAGGLMSYGVDRPDIYRLSATYVDRILRGEKPADLPVQEPIKYQTVANLKTAKSMGFDVPSSLLVRADEVIE
jgi:hypothetical protein